MPTAMTHRRDRYDRNMQSRRMLMHDRRLLRTVDGDMGMSNLAFVPRAGNISTDTRAG